MINRCDILSNSQGQVTSTRIKNFIYVYSVLHTAYYPRVRSIQGISTEALMYWPSYSAILFFLWLEIIYNSLSVLWLASALIVILKKYRYAFSYWKDGYNLSVFFVVRRKSCSLSSPSECAYYFSHIQMTVKQGLEKFFKNWVLSMNGERRLSFIQVSIPPRFVEQYGVTNYKNNMGSPYFLL